MLEKRLYQKLKNKWDGKYLKRIEPKGNGGIPDTHIVNKRGTVLFIELKAIKDEFYKINIRRSQILWFLSYPSKAYILLAVDKMYFLFDKSKIRQLQEIKTSYGTYKDWSIIWSYDIKEIINKINIL